MQLSTEARNTFFIKKKNAARQAHASLYRNNIKFINIRYNTEPKIGFKTY